MSCGTKDIESLSSKSNSSVSISQEQEEEKSFSNHIKPNDALLTSFVSDLVSECNKKPTIKKNEVESIISILKRKYRIMPSKHDVLRKYERNFSEIPISVVLKKWMIRKAVRANSGVLVATITLSPHKFSCKYDCFYCPQETDLKGVPTQPRSYLSTEPAMLRAIETRVSETTYDFDVRTQFQNRINAYLYNGSIKKDDTQSRKMEIILSGGTWESYPIEYREQVIQELYWAANTISGPRPIKTLKEEITENETAHYRIIGLTLETRPDNITPETIQDYCRWGATRIQIGVQHFDDAILKKINRKCYTKDTIRAIRLLKQAGFKVVVHMMPDLPGSSPEQDAWMFEESLTNPDLQFDDVKIYPTAVCKSPDEDRIVYSKIGDWYKNGTYMPYAETNINSLIDMLIGYKTKVHPWIRIQRLVRDIPGKSIESGYHKISNLRQIIHDKMKKEKKICNCIYCKEIGDMELDNLTPILVVRKYQASEGTEYHISMEAHAMNRYQKFYYWMFMAYSYLVLFLTGKQIYWSGDLESYIGLFGFLRLRFDPAPGGDFIPEINGCALIREVHVYGFSLGVGTDAFGSQHRGYGQLLVKTAEKISAMNGYKKTAVIAGIGTREYYKNKCGYHLGNTYMLKNLAPYNSWFAGLLVN